MNETAELELVPERDHPSKDTFKDESDYDTFWQGLLNRIKPRLDELAKARRASEEDAKRRHIA